MGLTLEVAEDSSTIFKFNAGYRDYERKLPIDNSTIFRMASLSKSPTSVGLLQQIEKNKLKLTQDISELLGFTVRNPNFPQIPITLEMILSHQSSFKECDAYYTFLHDTYIGPPFPAIKELLTPQGKYYNTCLFNKVQSPGTFYEYVNYNYAIASTILERVSGTRFDQYMAQNLFHVAGMQDTTYCREDLKHAGKVNNISVLYRADANKTWVPQADDWKGNMTERNFSSYVIGSNGAVFSPMGGLYSTTRDLIEFINIIRKSGLASNGLRVLEDRSGKDMVRLRYRYHGSNKAINSSENSYNAYGLGIQTTTYDAYDRIFPHKVVHGHWGDSYGLISEYEYVEKYSFVYVINGALNGYHSTNTSFYELERQAIHQLVNQYLYE
jgi:CubicO group peptidase (beta-lactamase class C family)